VKIDNIQILGSRQCSNSCTFTYEADVSSRPNGDGDVLTNDLVIMRQFAAHNLTPDTTTNEFQRADCAPRASNGDGKLDITDLQQARRYAGRLDALQAAGGPTQPAAAAAAAAAAATPSAPTQEKEEEQQQVRSFSSLKTIGNLLLDKPAANTVVRVVSTTASRGTNVTVSIEIDSQGTETGTQFTLKFDSTLTNPQVALGSGVPSGSALTLNTSNVANGEIGITVDSPNAFTAGTRQLVTVQFFIPQTAPGGTANLSFNADVTPESTSDAGANLVPTSYTNGTVNIASSPTAASVNVSGRVLTQTGRGIRNIIITMSDSGGAIRTTQTTAFGYYQFNDVQSGETYIITARGKHYSFTQNSKVMNINDETTNVDFIAFSIR
jgi:hypothetical protein